MDKGEQKRIQHILNVLLEYTQQDFTNKIELSGENDEIDAVALGVNTLGEELGFHIEALESKNNELAQTNEELEEQTEKLKEQQEELESTNEELEEQQQTIQDSNQALQNANKELGLKKDELEQTNRYKSEFLANMSHELRSPLNSLMILANDLADNSPGHLDENEVESAKIIYNSGKELLNLINDILDISKIEAGKMEMVEERVPISEVAESVTNTFEPLAKQKGISFEVTTDSRAPNSIQSDKHRIIQVLNNLISNAVKFTEEGEVQVNFSRHNKNQLKITVSDTGIGVPKEKQKIIFETFNQAEGGTARKYGGSGLGLAISFKLITLLGGTLDMQSTPGKGSVFSVLLPLKPEKPKETREAEAEQPIEQETVFSKSYLNYATIEDDRDSVSRTDAVILIIEDDERFAGILKKQAHTMNFKCLVAATGEDGLLLADKYHPDAILLDLGLPGIQGKTVVKELKKNKDLKHIPVHIISAKEGKEEDFDAVQYLSKPINDQELQGAFEKIEAMMDSQVKTLLLVEDHEDTRKALNKILESKSLEVLEAETVQQAKDLLKESHPDCIVLDLKLPDGTGTDVVRYIEDHANIPLPPVIVYTGKSLEEEEISEMKRWAESVIVKEGDSEKRLVDEVTLFLHQYRKNSQKQQPAESLEKTNTFEGKTILLVDDDMRNVFAISKVLSSRGADVLKANNGQKALDLLKGENNVDIVLMDIMMPNMDGYECTKRIREQEEYKDLPIIALTAKAMKEDREKCIQAGASDYMSKPVEIDKLLNLIKVWIH